MYWITDSFVIYKSRFDFFNTKVSNFSSNTGKVHFEELLNLLGYIRGDKPLGLKYYSNNKDAPLDKLILRLRTSLWTFLIIVGSISQTLAEVQERILSFTKVVQLTMAHMLQDQLIHKMQKVITMQHSL